MADKDVTEPQQSDDDARPETEASAATSEDVTSIDQTPSGAEVEKDLLVTAGTASSLRPKRKAAPAEVEPAGSSREKGARKTRKRAEAVAEHKAPRVGPVTFIQQSVAELKKVVWPTGDQLRQYFVVVLVFVLIVIAYVSGLDALFGWLLLKLLG